MNIIPDYVKYLQVFIFNADPSGYVDDNYKVINYLDSILTSWNRTNFSDISRSSVTLYHPYISASIVFDGTTDVGLPSSFWIVVLGFDATLNLTHASPVHYY